MSFRDFIKENDFLSTHLKYVYHTESPLIMHTWSAVLAASASLSRHAYLKQGIGKLYPNMYCLLVGPPGTRKSRAMKFASNLMNEATNVKFAPDDTGGQRQGLITAIADSDADSLQDRLQNKTNLTDLNLFTDSDLNEFGNIQLEVIKNNPDKYTMFINATEFGSFLGQGSLEMTRFLIKMWDGEDYKYKLKKEFCTLKDASLNLIGGTTPSDLSTLLPPEAIGQGFMSRVILVYNSKREKRLSPSQSYVDKKYEKQLKDIYKYLYFDHRTTMTMSKGATKLEDELYHLDIKIPDTRFIYYAERRHDHLAKLALVIAASNQRAEISQQDMFLANKILIETEKTMPEALGEYGLSPLAQSRQKMVEFVQQANGPVTATILWAMMRRDMKLIDFKNAVSDLINAGKITETKTSYGPAFVYNENVTAIDEVIIKKQETA